MDMEHASNMSINTRRTMNTTIHVNIDMNMIMNANINMAAPGDACCGSRTLAMPKETSARIGTERSIHGEFTRDRSVGSSDSQAAAVASIVEVVAPPPSLHRHTHAHTHTHTRLQSV